MTPRRSFARKLLAAPVAALFSASAARAQAQRVVWTDIALLDGRVLRASELSGRPVVVQMWASWCPFCARQNPHIEALHRKHGRDLVVIGFTIDKTEQAARGYLRRHGYTFPAAMATPQVERWFGRRRALPEVYVVDRDGRIVLREQGEMFPEDVMALARFARPAG
jgi:thiol-disulfide isomerase/thioredoxin